jgi:hypothetical protein
MIERPTSYTIYIYGVEKSDADSFEVGFFDNSKSKSNTMEHTKKRKLSPKKVQALLDSAAELEARAIEAAEALFVLSAEDKERELRKEKLRKVLGEYVKATEKKRVGSFKITARRVKAMLHLSDATATLELQKEKLEAFLKPDFFTTELNIKKLELYQNEPIIQAKLQELGLFIHRDMTYSVTKLA